MERSIERSKADLESPSTRTVVSNVLYASECAEAGAAESMRSDASDGKVISNDLRLWCISQAQV